MRKNRFWLGWNKFPFNELRQQEQGCRREPIRYALLGLTGINLLAKDTESIGQVGITPPVLSSLYINATSAYVFNKHMLFCDNFHVPIWKKLLKKEKNFFYQKCIFTSSLTISWNEHQWSCYSPSVFFCIVAVQKWVEIIFYFFFQSIGPLGRCFL